MSADPSACSSEAINAARLVRLEARLTRIEAHLGIGDQTEEVSPLAASEPAVLPPSEASASTSDELEFELGQSWFAGAGIAVLTIGAGFLLSLPHAGLSPAVPSLLGYVAAALLFAFAKVGRRTFAHATGVQDGAWMALLYWATLRLFFFGEQPALDIHGWGGGAVLVAASVFNLGFAWLRRSPWLMGLALVTSGATPLMIGNGGFVAVTVVVLAVVVVIVSRQTRWPGLVLAGIGLVWATYFSWSIGNPFLGGGYHWTREPWFAPGCLLAAILIYAVAPLFRASEESDDAVANAGAVLNCFLGYGTFLFHTAVGFRLGFVTAHGVASAMFLGLAVAFWTRRRSQVSTFFYAMTGYAALTVVICKATALPDVFVWLSLQSIVVAATAIWFRSRFIIVANFLIYVAIMGGYILMNERESGISIGFGIVALVSARILNWQQARLDLKTGLMRNAYLISAFLVFPYALHHLVPDREVALSWIGLAVVYYGLSIVVRNQKYRWMGHATLVLAACRLVAGGSTRVDPLHGLLSFLALGTVLLGVSLVFAKLRRRASENENPPEK